MRPRKYPNLWRGCVGAWCPSEDRSRSNRLTDFSGYNNHGVLTNMDPATDWVPSGGKMALDFDGVNDQLVFPAFNLSNNLTWCIWVHKTSATANHHIFGQGDGLTTGMYLQTNGSSQFVVYVTQVSISGGLLESNKWTAVSVTKTGSSISLYVNGTIRATGTASPTDSTTPLAVGYVRFNSGNFYSGSSSNVDDFRVYNRALSPSEIRTLSLRRGIAYETERPRRTRSVPVPTKVRTARRIPKRVYPNLWRGCVGAWCPSEDRSRSNRLTDFSGYNNHGVLTNMDPATDWVPSQGKMALDFDGVNDHAVLTTTDQTILNLPSQNQWSVAFWFFAGTLKGDNALLAWSGVDGLLFYGGDSAANRQRMFWSNRGGALAFTTTDLTAGWSHYCIAATDSTQLTYSQNGIASANTTITGSSSSFTNCYIANSTRYSQFGRSLIDDIRFYNRAITPSEIRTLSLRRGIAYETERPRRYWAVTTGNNRRRSLRYLTFPG